MSAQTQPIQTTRSSALELLPIIAVVFVAYLVIGLALPVLPLHVNRRLGMSSFVVGVVAGSQFGAAFVSRVFAGQYADSRGPKRSVVVGLLTAAAAGALYLVSLEAATTTVSLAILLLGRVLLGTGESFIITGALSWGLTLLGPQNTGKVMAWVGTAIYAAFAVGAPVGAALHAQHGFAPVALATLLMPLAALVLVVRLHAVIPPLRERASATAVAGAVWWPGMVLALSGVGFGAITTFVALLYAYHGWSEVWMAFTALSVAFMVGRLFFGHLPDRIGGARVALICMLIEAAGQALIWLSGAPALALAGAALTGLGYSLVYPALGVEAVRRVPPHSRGLALGAFTAFLDLSLCLASPALGLVANVHGLRAVFFVSTVVVLGAAALTLRMVRG